IYGRESGVDLAGILLVHGHGDFKPAPLPAKAVHHLEAPHVGAHEQSAAAAVGLREQQGLALERDVECRELAVQQIDAIMNRGGKTQYLAKAVARAWRPPQR